MFVELLLWLFGFLLDVNDYDLAVLDIEVDVMMMMLMMLISVLWRRVRRLSNASRQV